MDVLVTVIKRNGKSICRGNRSESAARHHYKWIDEEMVMLVKVAVPLAVIESQWLVCTCNRWYPWYHNGIMDQNEAFNW